MYLFNGSKKNYVEYITIQFLYNFRVRHHLLEENDQYLDISDHDIPHIIILKKVSKCVIFGLLLIYINLIRFILNSVPRIKFLNS